MCGIAGFVTSKSPSERAICDTLNTMIAAMAHRGPDGHGTHATAVDRVTIGLAQVRLAIIDVAGGIQPLHSVDGRHTLVYNGEIYNYLEIREELIALGHSFATRSDTEVLMLAYRQWGPDCLIRLRGMFAFALLDNGTGELFLARDPYGKKPLFYIEKEGELQFASEIASLVSSPLFSGEVSRAALARYLVFKYVPGPGTLFRDIQQIRPGHFARFHKGALHETGYFDWPAKGQPAEAVERPTTADFKALLTESVRIRMRSDVPVGAFLSGGLDSSTIVALMAGMTDMPVKTFSVGFEDDAYSELWAADMVAKRYKTEHHELKITPESYIENIGDVTWKRGAPLSEMADVPVYLLSRLARQTVKVVLSGEGADELLGGYPKHWGEDIALRFQSLVPEKLQHPLLKLMSAVLPYRYRRAAILLRVLRERDFMDRQAAWFGVMNAEDMQALAPQSAADYHRFDWAEDPGPDISPLRRVLRFDKMVWLPGTLLERGDRMTMAASIEARMPFMDVELMRFVERLSDQQLVRGRVGKAILRDAAADLVPPEILTRPKVGFRVPIAEWLRGTLRDFTRDALLGPQSTVRQFCDAAAIERLLDDHDQARVNREKEIWALLALEVFLRECSIRSGKPVRLV